MNSKIRGFSPSYTAEFVFAIAMLGTILSCSLLEAQNQAPSPSPVEEMQKNTSGPTPYPTDKANWPGEGSYRVFPWMIQNRQYFWTQREKDQGGIVFAGDSLVGNWKSVGSDFSGLHVINRGIGGDTSRGLLFRFQEDVLDLHPKEIIILIGTNDLSARQKAKITIGNIEKILDQIQISAPDAKVMICTVPPRDSAEAPADQSELQALNHQIFLLQATHKNFTVIDLNRILSKSDGSQDFDNFMPDKLHLSTEGYKKWRDAMISEL